MTRNSSPTPEPGAGTRPALTVSIMDERNYRPEPSPAKSDQVAAGGAILLITAGVIGVVGLILVTLGQFFAAPLVVLALALWAVGKWKLKHDSGLPPTASPPAR